jgi:xanthine dehydrogenase small subunit
MKTSTAPVFRAGSLQEALSLRSTHPQATVLAGGTDVMVYIESDSLSPTAILDLWPCDELRGVSVEADGAVAIGALTTWTDVALHPSLPAALRDCALTVGALAIQNRGTVGGNIVNASPAGDSLPLWLAMEAVFELGSLRGRRLVPAAAFFRGYKLIDLAPDELLLRVHIPVGAGAGLTYRKVGTRLAQAISKVVLGGRIVLAGGVVVRARVALGSVGPVPLRCRSVETALLGRAIDPGAADFVLDDIRPIDDVRSTADYRARVSRNIVHAWLTSLAGDLASDPGGAR